MPSIDYNAKRATHPSMKYQCLKLAETAAAEMNGRSEHDGAADHVMDGPSAEASDDFWTRGRDSLNPCDPLNLKHPVCPRNQKHRFPNMNGIKSYMAKHHPKIRPIIVISAQTRPGDTCDRG